MAGGYIKIELNRADTKKNSPTMQANNALRDASLKSVIQTVKMHQKIVFVTGKGGVGKSAVAAAEAYRYSQSGLKTLLVELGDHSYFSDFLRGEMGESIESSSQAAYRGTPTTLGFNVARWSGPLCLREYILHIIKIAKLYDLFFANPIMTALVDIAPGLNELAVLGKITSGYRHVAGPLPWDVIVVDAYATGHFLALMRAPKGMAEAIQFGPMGEQSRSIQKFLLDPDICSYKVVTTPEELAVQEGIELAQTLKTEFSLSAEVLLNKEIPISMNDENVQGDTSFSKYIAGKISMQKEFKRKIVDAGFAARTVPFIYSNRAVEVIQKMSEAMT